MKKFFLLSILPLMIFSAQENPAPEKQPQSVPSQTKPADTEFSGSAVLANCATMLNGFGNIVQDPYNPASFGPGIAQIGSGFFNILAEIFKDMPQEQLRARVEHYFNNLSEDEKLTLIMLVMAYADNYRNKCD